MKNIEYDDNLQEIQLRDDDGNEQRSSDSNPSSEVSAIGCFIYFRGFFFGKKCHSRAKLTDKTVIITGGNTGIGKETALDLASRGANIIIACRDVKKGNDAAAEICKNIPSANVDVKYLNLASFQSIREFAADVLQNVPQIHILINNAGVAGCPKSQTEEGFEMQFGVNHLGHFLLTNLLLERIKASAPARIINVSSVAHILGKINFNDINLDHRYQPLMAYCRSKLANVLFTKELAKRLQGTGVTTYSLHPGAVHTGLGRHLGSSINRFIGHLYEMCSKLFFMSTQKGAQTTVYCAVEESIAEDSGFYYSDCTKMNPSSRAKDDNLAKKLWNISENLIASVS